MRKSFYEVVFEATETLQNGKERTVRKSVLMPHFNDAGRHICPAEQIERGEQALREAYYYNIKHIETKNKTLIFG